MNCTLSYCADIIHYMIDSFFHKVDAIVFFLIAVLVFIKPALLHRFSLYCAKWSKNFFKGSNFENFSKDAYESAKKDPEGSIIQARFLSLILFLFACLMLQY